jgi:predicted AAA+ superfamily ATPase
MNINYQLGLEIFHWRSRAGEEVDFLIQINPNEYLFIEVKVSPVKTHDLADMAEVRKVFKNQIPDMIVCHQEGEHVLGQYVPVAKLKDYLLKIMR